MNEANTRHKKAFSHKTISKTKGWVYGSLQNGSSLRGKRAPVQSSYFHNRPPTRPQFVNRVVVNRVEGKCEQTSQLKNKSMDSVKPASITTSQAGSKLYAYTNYLRGAQFVNRVVVDGMEGKGRQSSQP